MMSLALNVKHLLESSKGSALATLVAARIAMVAQTSSRKVEPAPSREPLKTPRAPSSQASPFTPFRGRGRSSIRSLTRPASTPSLPSSHAPTRSSTPLPTPSPYKASIELQVTPTVDTLTTVPTVAMRNGSFSGLINGGGAFQQHYAPAITHSSANKWAFTAFPEVNPLLSQIPSSRSLRLGAVAHNQCLQEVRW
jgi:hypothetical protein